jgi:drug/metabolite transporter (DMT)-like permease
VAAGILVSLHEFGKGARRIDATSSAQRRAHGPGGTALALVYVFLWSSAFVPSRIVAMLGQPLWVLAVRFIAAALIQVALTFILARPWPRSRASWISLGAFGLLANAGYLSLTYEALRHLSAGMGAIIASTNPLVLALVAPALLGEALSPRKLVGLVFGFSGVLMAMASRAGSPFARPVDIGMAFIAVLALVASTIVFKRLRLHEDLVAANAIQLGTSAVFLVPLAWAIEGRPHLPLTAPLVWSLTYLVLLLSIGASFVWFWLLRHGEASRVSAFYFLTPIFGLGLAALLLHERVTWLDAVALAAVAFGITLVQGRPEEAPFPASGPARPSGDGLR